MYIGQMTSSPVNRRDTQKRIQMLQGVPAAYGRFQDALDRFEAELVRNMATSRARKHAHSSVQIRARAVMRRDLAKCRAAREQREKAAQEKSMHAINQGPKAEQGEKKAEAEKLFVTATKDEPQQSNTTTSTSNVPPASAPTTKIAHGEELSTLPTVTTFTNPIPPSTTASMSTAPQTSTSAPTVPPLSATFASPSATADMPDIDIVSMFEDFENANPGDHPFGQGDANVDVADVSSLFGINTFANINGDAAGDSQTQKVEGVEDGDLEFTMLGLPGDEEGQKQDGDIQFEENFEELFAFGEWSGGEGDGEWQS